MAVALFFALSLAVGSLGSELKPSNTFSTYWWVTVPVVTVVLGSCFFVGLVLLFSKIENLDIRSTNSYRGIWSLSSLKRRVILFLALAAPWFGYWLFLWPGVTTRDSFDQLLQAWGLVGYSDQHPILNTIAIQLIFRPSLALSGSPSFAVGVVSLIQLIVIALIVSTCIDALRNFNPPSWALYTTLIFFSLNPIIGWYSVTLWKDVWLAVFTLAVATLIALVIRYSLNGQRVSLTIWLLLAFSLIGLMASKKTGMYIAVPTLIFVFFLLPRRALFKWFSLSAVSVAVFLLLYTSVMSALGVRPGSEIEAWSLPSQQIARVVAKHGGQLSLPEKAEIEQFFPNSELGKLYVPNVSNKVKAVLDPVELKNNRTLFLSLWATLGAKYPMTYAEAFVASTYGYWYPPVSYWIVSDLDLGKMIELDGGKVVNSQQVLPYNLPTHATPESIQGVAQDFINNKVRNFPVIGWLFSLGIWLWITVIFGAISFIRKQKPAVSVVFISGLVTLSSVLSPVFAEARYVFPLLLLIPLLSVLSLTGNSQSSNLLNPRNEDHGGAN